MALSYREVRYFGRSFGDGGISEEEYLSKPEGYYSKPLKVVFSWNATQDVVNNTSTINFKVEAEALEYQDTQYLKLTPNWITASVYDKNEAQYGETVIDTITSQYIPDCKLYVGEGLKTISDGSFTLTHKKDGTNSINFKYGIDIPFKGGYKLVNGVETEVFSLPTGASYGYIEFIPQEVVLDTIARHAIIYTDEAREVKDFTDEDTVAINYAVPSGLTGYIYLSLDGNATTETTALKAVTGSGVYNYSFSATDQAKLWGIQPLITKRVRFFIKSVSNIDGVTYREPSNYVNLEIINYMPTLDTDVWEDANNDCVKYLTGNQRVMVRHVSVPKFKTGGESHKGATIETQYCAHGGVNKFGATGEFTTVSGDDTKAHFDFAITDNYGRTHQETMEFSTTVGNYVPYVKLTSSATATPMTGDGDVTVTITGKFFSGDFGLKENKMRISFDIAENNGEWNHYDVGYATSASYYGNSFSINGTDYTYTLNLNATDHGLKYLNVYDLRIMVSDEVTHEPLQVETILAAVPIFDWSRTDFAFYVPVTINEAAVPSIVEQVLNDNGWSYRKWSDGTAECWRTLSVTTAVSTSTNASWYSSGELSSTNLSFPFTFKARPSVTVQTMPTGSSWCIVFPSNTTGSTTKTGSYQLNSMSSTSSRAHLLSYDVKGRWK